MAKLTNRQKTKCTMLNIACKDRKTNIWVRERTKVIYRYSAIYY